MNKLILGTLFAASFSAQAADIQNVGDWSKAESSVIVGYASRHIDSDDHKYLNENNPAIGFEAWDIQAIYIKRNSWNHESLYLTYAPDWEINKHVSLSMQVGIATGYKCNLSVRSGSVVYHNNYCSTSGVVPMTALTLSVKPFSNGLSVDLSANPSVAMFSVSYEL